MADFAANSTFALVPSIPADLGCPDHIDKHDPVMRKEQGCKYERVTLCAADAIGDGDARFGFLACLDRAALPLVYNASFARTCMGTVGEAAKWQAAESCFDGPRGDTLVADAQRKTSEAGSGIPSVLVDGVEACGSSTSSCDYETVARALRAAA